MRSQRPKTIRIFLIDGEPDGLRTVELSNWIGQAIVIPRNKLKDIKKLIGTEYMEQKNGTFLFIKDYIFNSPTAAAEVILGHPASGWERWKTEKGQTLKEFYTPNTSHIESSLVK